MEISSLEKNIIKKIEKYSEVLYFLSMIFLAILIRWNGLRFCSSDYNDFLEPWFYEIKYNGGIRALKAQVGDYNIPYQTIIAMMTMLPINRPLRCYKIISIFFDVFLSMISMLICKDICKLKIKKSKYIIVLLLLTPTIFLNSAWWGQCDSIYVTFILLAIYFLNKNIRKSLFFLGIAFSFKLQTIFVIPFYVLYYLKTKKHTILNIIYMFFGIYVLCIPAILVGRNVWDPILIYFTQIKEYPQMSINFPGFWNLLTSDYMAWGKLAILTTLVILLSGMYLIFKNQKINLEEMNFVLPVIIWSVWTIILFLPSMHERYAYLVNVLLIIASVLDRKYWKYAITGELVGLITYSNYLMILEVRIPIIVVSLLYLGMWSLFSFELLKNTQILNKRVFSEDFINVSWK